MTRENDNRDKVSNLLNMADGLFGDLLKLHVICTANCPMGAIDPALMRRGRLVAHREFRRLEESEACRLALAKQLEWAPTPDQETYSLTEIYNASESTLLMEENQSSIGFAQR